MKLVALVLLSVLISFSLSSGCGKENACEVCQQIIYRLKFKFTSNCGNLAHCKNTCTKVLKEWSKPGSTFEAFQADNVGKCDACFRAGYCSQTYCQGQKRHEEMVIQKVIDSNDYQKKDQVSSREMDSMVKKVLRNDKVNFNHMAKKVQEQTLSALEAKAFAKRKGKLAKSLAEVAEY